MTGIIKKIVSARGFGFIEPAEGGKHIFFHMSALDGVPFENLQEEQEVEFRLEDSEKGPRAIGIRLI